MLRRLRASPADAAACRALADGGHEVAVAVAADLLPRAEAAGFTAFGSGINSGEGFGRLGELFPD
ncbi:MAG TPA: hypothetical protein VIP52_06380, partial [Candidatus Dormibacteraeota bacterium]